MILVCSGKARCVLFEMYICTQLYLQARVGIFMGYVLIYPSYPVPYCVAVFAAFGPPLTMSGLAGVATTRGMTHDIKSGPETYPVDYATLPQSSPYRHGVFGPDDDTLKKPYESSVTIDVLCTKGPAQQGTTLIKWMKRPDDDVPSMAATVVFNESQVGDDGTLEVTPIMRKKMDEAYDAISTEHGGCASKHRRRTGRNV
jgi:hypothetical protein